MEGRDAVLANCGFAVSLKRLGRPDLLAAAALFLTTDESSYMGRTEGLINGAMTAIQGSVAYVLNT